MLHNLGCVQGDLLGDVGVSGAVSDGVDHENKRLLMKFRHPRAPKVMCGPVVLA